ncbi:pyrroline-5-carboxylate reductase [Drosophila miranda]|uniref:pyrroline-5-carboxylate reductase-like n=1 Tax=Drosophila miranda TaxID=7229 RepID=UPI00143FAC5A|nr:pyrroline-5-carboxylate reductase-like [Drosophila miranda]XP_033244840.1 pyrroline-5-carboxylate reductase-like [Drosophila miranda]XP_033245434.1 pyrroline-5-carboxylate reductase [Drosophila miranda]
MAKLDERIGFIGGGNMAFAIGSGLVRCAIVKPSQVLVSGPHIENLSRWRELGAVTTDDNCKVLEHTDVVFICVKPHILGQCASQLKYKHVPSAKDASKLIVSVLAGTSLKTLEEKFNFMESWGPKVIRTMPNTSMQVGEGCTVYTGNARATHQDLEKVHIMLNALGLAQQVPEQMIDAVTGLAGCGPAFVYTIIEALADGGVKQGVPRAMALQFAAQTLLGAAKTVLITGKHPAVLRDEVCSPGGSTIVGVHELEKGNLRATLINAVEKATQRSTELGKK